MTDREKAREFTMKDWYGNEVKEGDILVFVNIYGQQDLTNLIYEDPENKRLYRIRHKVRNRYGFGWREYHYSKVFDIEGVLYADVPSHDGSGIIAMPLKLICDFHVQQKGTQLGNFFCIKGISDNHEEFYKHFFREGVSCPN